MLIKALPDKHDWLYGTPIVRTGFVAAHYWTEVEVDNSTTAWHRASDIQDVEFDESLAHKRYLCVIHKDYCEAVILSGHVIQLPRGEYYGTITSDNTVNFIPVDKLMKITKVNK
jgi:hypothetical protein